MKKYVFSFLLLAAFVAAAGWASFRPDFRLWNDTEWEPSLFTARWGSRSVSLVGMALLTLGFAGWTSILGRFLFSPIPAEERTLPSFAVSIALFSAISFALAVNGVLHGSILAFFCLPALKEGWIVLRGSIARFAGSGGRWAPFLAVPFILLWFPEFLAPPLAWDAVLDHSRFAREVARTRELPLLWPDHTGNMPKLTDILLAALHSMGGEALARMGNLLSLVLAVLGLRHLFRATGEAVRIATVILLSSGAFLFLFTFGYVEGFLAAFSLGALACLVESLKGGKHSSSWAAASAFLLGCAMGVKYTAVLAAAGLLAVWLFPPRGSVRPRLSLAWVGWVLLPVLPWLLRNDLSHGNPVYPLLTGLLGAGPDGYSPGMEKLLMADTGSPASLAPADVLRNVWRAFFTPENQVGAFFSPLVLMALPWAARAWKDPRGRALALFAGGSLLAWCLVATSLRHAAIPMLALAAFAGLAWQPTGDRSARWVFAAGWAVSLWLAFAAQLRTDAPWPAALGLESRDSRLARHYHFDRDVFAAYRAVERDATPGDRVLAHGVFQAYPLKAPVHVDFKWKTPHLYRWGHETGTAKGLAENLRRRGIRYILYQREEASRMVPKGAPDSRKTGETPTTILPGMESAEFWGRHVEMMFVGDNTLVYRLATPTPPRRHPVIDTPDDSLDGTAMRWLRRASEALDRNDCPGAMEAVGKARSLGLENDELAVIMASCLKRRGREVEARREADRAVLWRSVLEERIRKSMNDE